MGRRKAYNKAKDDEIGDMKEAGAKREADAGSDEEDPELYEQLSKQRRLVRRSDDGAVKKGEAALSTVSERIQMIQPEEDAEDKNSEADKPGLGAKGGREGDAIALT